MLSSESPDHLNLRRSIILSRISRLFLEWGLIAGLALGGMPVHGQTVDRYGGTNAPDQQKSASTQSNSGTKGTSSISGTVLDTNGDVIAGAQVKVAEEDASGAPVQEMDSGTMGQFEFSNLQPGTYTVTVSGNGMSTFVSKPIVLHAERPELVPKVVLSVAAAVTSVTVMDKEAASVEQAHIAVQQRVFKVFPNFYSSFDWNAPPLMPKQKYTLASRTLFDPVTFLTTGIVAGAEQYKNVFPSFGGGIGGYGKRYATVYANHASGELLTRAIYPSLFHSDPRYFVMGKGSTRTRAEHAVMSTFVTRGDDGGRKVNFPEILGSFTSAALSNAYYPAEERGAHLVMINGFGDLGGDLLDNLFREFLLNHWTSRGKR